MCNEHAEPCIFSVVLRPHASLGPRGFVVLMSAIVLIGVFTGSIFVISGAWPVTGFIGLDVVLVYLAFRASYWRARSYETVEMTRDVLTVRKVSSSGRVRSWEFQPYWLRVEIDKAETVKLSSHGRQLKIGSFLGQDERIALAQALDRALSEARLPPQLASSG